MAVSGGTKSWSRLEPGKMPAWKQEVLERKRQKMASSCAAGPQSSRGKDASPSRSSRKGSPERLVLQDSLGPIKENPFIKLEKERRRRRPQHQHHPPPGSGRATSPIRQLLDIYSHVPGIRTIRADNIIIIESDPGYFKQSSQVAGAATGDPVEELLAKRGSKVAEIRASEVIIYEPEVPKKEAAEKSPVEAKRESQEHNQVLEEAGRVSRLLEKFNRGNGRPVRTRSWENLLERDQKPPILPKPPTADRPGQAPQIKAPRRSGEVSPSSVSIFEEDGKRFPLNNPSWLPSKPPALHSLPDPGLFHKRPSSPISPSATVTPVSPSSPLTPLSPNYELSSDETLVSPMVASVREKFEIGYTNNHHPLSKLMTVSQRTGSNTIIVNPKAASISKAHPQDTIDGVNMKNAQHLTNGHVEHSETNAKSGGSVNIQDLLSKSKRPRGSTSTQLSEGSGIVPSSVNKAANEVSKGANDRRPNFELDFPKNSIPPKSSATLAENSFPNHHDQGFTSATPSQLLKVASSTSSNDSFEIRPAPKPDLSNIPEDDIQAKALANIRLQSKNTFVFVPKKRQVPSEPKQTSVVKVSSNEKPKVQISASTLNGPKLDSTDSVYHSTQSKESSDLGNGDDGVEQVENRASSVPSLLDFDWKSGLVASKTRENQSFTDIGAELEYFSNVQQGDAAGVINVPVTNIHEDFAKPDIPVTNIDDIVTTDEGEAKKETKPVVKVTADPVTPAYRPHASLSSVRTKGPNTFTVVPKRKPITEQEAFRTPVVDEEDEDDASSKRKSSDGSEALYPELGALLKKRYPTVDEIKVIGGYMSLSKSCLSKNVSTRKKMNISFNEQNIHTMFEYPSENSLAEGEDEDSESDEEERPSSTMFPRASFGSSGGTTNGLRTKSPNSDLSTYTPKHSMEYSRWQDEKTLERSSSQDSDGQSEDMQKKAKLGRS